MKKEIEWVFTVNPNNDDLVRSIMEQKLIKVSKVLEKFKADNIVREAKVADYEIRGNQHIAIAINVNDPKDVHWFDIDPDVNNDAFIRACGWAYEPEDDPGSFFCFNANSKFHKHRTEEQAFKAIFEGQS